MLLRSLSSFLPRRQISTMSRLTNKTILITGASSGIGRSTAYEFSRASPDIRLILTARRIDTLRTIAADLETSSGGRTKVLPIRFDVSDSSEEWRDIHVLVNNAGLVKGVDKVGEIKEEDINEMMGTNLTQQIVKLYYSRGGKGDIINIGSIAGREPYAGGAIYCASKAAVRSFTDSLRKELVATRIRVMEIDPGQVETEFSVVRFGGDKEKADAVYAGCEPLTPEDIAEVVVFVAGRRENVVIADTMIYPSHQGGASVIHRRS
ncbi:hypothetical protein BDD12DRAFT_812422 [Trichophaea hybrida]|nr:hypothetical protein BDD12DRAFT_812422 [Trichophaea hybrida]